RETALKVRIGAILNRRENGCQRPVANNTCLSVQAQIAPLNPKRQTQPIVVSRPHTLKNAALRAAMRCSPADCSAYANAAASPAAGIPRQLMRISATEV